MHTFSLLISFSFVILFGYFLARMTWSIGSNLAQGRKLRRDLHERLTELPLGHALQRAGTDLERYLHTRHVHEIDRELRNCSGCHAVRECRSALDTAVPIEKFGFCPNYDTLFKS